MKRIPTDDMEVLITSDARVISRCALGQKEEELFPAIPGWEERLARLRQAITRDARASTTEKDFAFVDGDGAVLKVATLAPAEANMANQILQKVGSDRRWMEIEEMDSSEEDDV